MRTIIDPNTTNRAVAFRLWMTNPMPMETYTKTFDVTHIRRYAKRNGLHFTAIMNWCIVQAATYVQEFKNLPLLDKMYHFDELAVGQAIENKEGGLNFCHLRYKPNFKDFYQDYLKYTAQVAEECKDSRLDEECMVIGTSPMPSTEMDSMINQYNDKFTNPILLWGRYRKHWWRYKLPISFQFHHVQMDGLPAARFLEQLQIELNQFKG